MGNPGRGVGAGVTVRGRLGIGCRRGAGPNSLVLPRGIPGRSRLVTPANQGLPGKYLPSLPDDPYDNAPLRYRFNETMAVVYSIGPDMDDDAAQGLSWNEFVSDGDGDVILDVIFGAKSGPSNSIETGQDGSVSDL